MMAQVDRRDLFSALLRQQIQASLYSYGQLAQLSGVPKRTIVNWLDGTVRHPRQWQSVVRVAAALRQTFEQTNELLAAAELPTLQSLLVDANEPADQALLAQWKQNLSTAAPSIALCLRNYLRALSSELARLPAYFPQQSAFAFSAIYQDLRLRRLEWAIAKTDHSIGSIGGSIGRTRDDETWSVLRQQAQRAVILGQPGMGKTWLFKAEAIRLAKEALASDPKSEPPVLPLFVRIPDLVKLLAGQTSLQAILHAVAELAARLTPSLSEEELRAALRAMMEKSPNRVVFLLDALDEVPAREGQRSDARRAIMQLGSATPARIFLSCRTLGYAAAPLARYLGSDVREYELLPFTYHEIGRVMRAWYHGRLEQHQRLQLAMRRAPALIRQASNPLLLSLMCVLNETRGDELIAHRSGLYGPVLRLLLEGRWRSFDMQLPEGRVRRKIRLLEVIAWCYATYRQGWWEQLSGDVLEQAIDQVPDAQKLWATWQAEWGAIYEGPLWELSEWDGILVKGFVPVDGAVSAVPYSFLHRTFQEFLVARYLLRRYAAEGLAAAEIQEFLAHKAADPEWYMVLLLLVEQLTVSPYPDAKPFLNHLSDFLIKTAQDRTGQMAVAAVEILLNLRVTEVGTEVVLSLRDRLINRMRNSEVTTRIRVHAARLVAKLGDPRPAVMDVDAIKFVEIPQGAFLMGSDPARDPESSSDEYPQHRRTLERYAISRYPISNAQYRCFLTDQEDGYDNPAYWPEAIALGHWRDGMVWRMRPVHRPDGRVAWEPEWAREPNQPGWPVDLPNSPILGISWYEARAFVRWLENRWRRSGIIAPAMRLDLPSEAEWEKAARGVDGSIYPWGDDFDGERLNWFGHMLMAPVPIGAFPNSSSPFGAEEMVGNLWEWTRSLYQPYAAEKPDGADFAHAVAPDVDLALRGGAYYSARNRCRCATRLASLPIGRINATFRIVKVEG
ncbi:MAG: SUMF1/EgtB/PvdO family nonheme iron enzyme [Caldilineaceae bacterium]|nr:SUMF1/EgtB/PvdO family nonheme iron enzyme [Caldilineaceae bacterium]